MKAVWVRLVPARSSWRLLCRSNVHGWFRYRRLLREEWLGCVTHIDICLGSARLVCRDIRLDLEFEISAADVV